ncbi:hypothetical protein LHZ41_RS23890, partial [Escherichia coli]
MWWLVTAPVRELARNALLMAVWRVSLHKTLLYYVYQRVTRLEQPVQKCPRSEHGKFSPYNGFLTPLLFSFSHINDGIYSDGRVFRLCQSSGLSCSFVHASGYV